MRQSATSQPDAAAANGGPPRPTPGPPIAELDLDDAGRRVFMTARQRAAYDGRLALWDRATQTAFEVRDAGPRHEHPAQRLAALVERIAQVRGKPIHCFGAMSLFLLGDDGRTERMMEADQTVYLHPDRANLEGRARMFVGQDPYPDVVLEVDNTTDIRRHKLRVYEAWRVPELWVEVPDTSPRPAKWHGLTIRVLVGDALEEVAESRAFPGWRAADIHAALNEKRLSQRTSAILERIGAALGVREGTGPDDDPLLRSQRRQAAAEARSVERVAETRHRARMVRTIMASRRVEVAANFPLEVPGFATAGPEDVAWAALRCADEADFAARLQSATKPE